MSLNNLLKLTIALGLVVIFMGAYTRLADAGLGCPDWPGCYGQLTVPVQEVDIINAQKAYPERPVDQTKAWLEMIHRYIAGMLALLVFTILIICIKNPKLPKKLPIFIASLVIFQAALGMWTVTMKLMPIVVIGHLIGGFSLVALLFLLYLRTNKKLGSKIKRVGRSLSIYYVAIFSLIILSLQIMLGGWTSANYAALSCTVLPICEGDWLANLKFIQAFSPLQGEHHNFEFGVLDYSSRMTIHISHRIGAIVTSLSLLYLVVIMVRDKSSPLIKNSGCCLASLLCLQLSLGISNVVFHLPLITAVFHNITAVLLLMTLIFITYITRQRNSLFYS